MPKKNLEVRLNAETIKRLIEFSGYEEEEIAKKLRIPLRRIREGKLTERGCNSYLKTYTLIGKGSHCFRGSA